MLGCIFTILMCVKFGDDPISSLDFSFIDTFFVVKYRVDPKSGRRIQFFVTELVDDDIFVFFRTIIFMHGNIWNLLSSITR